MAKYYPPVGFHFRVDIDGITDGDQEISFQEVSGLNATIGEFTYKEGGENRFIHRLPDRATYEKLVLKRGMLVGSKMISWFKDAVESFKFDPKDIIITLLNTDHEPLESWSIVKAYPVKWSISGFNAQQNEIVVETIELVFQYFNRLEIN